MSRDHRRWPRKSWAESPGLFRGPEVAVKLVHPSLCKKARLMGPQENASEESPTAYWPDLHNERVGLVPGTQAWLNTHKSLI